MFFNIEKSEQTTSNFSQSSVRIIYNRNSEDHKFIEWFNEESKFATKKMVCYKQLNSKRCIQSKQFYQISDRKY